MGLHESFDFGDPENFKKLFPKNLSFEELRKAMDRFYDEPENLPIPLIVGQTIVTLKANGESPQLIAEMIADARKNIATANK